MIEQGSADWYAARAGKVTASRISDMLARIKTGWGASRRNYAAQLIAERLTGKSQEEGRYVSFEMQRGTETEPEARADYEWTTDQTVTQIGFVNHPTILMSGASPDGLVGDDGLIEIKCPNTSTHIDTLLGRTIPNEYQLQMQWQMACTGRQWCDFVSYDNRMPENMRRFRQRLTRNDILIREIESETRVFIAEIDDTVAKLRALYPEEIAA